MSAGRAPLWSTWLPPLGFAPSAPPHPPPLPPPSQPFQTAPWAEDAAAEHAAEADQQEGRGPVMHRGQAPPRQQPDTPAEQGPGFGCRSCLFLGSLLGVGGAGAPRQGAGGCQPVPPVPARVAQGARPPRRRPPRVRPGLGVPFLGAWFLDLGWGWKNSKAFCGYRFRPKLGCATGHLDWASPLPLPCKVGLGVEQPEKVCGQRFAENPEIPPLHSWVQSENVAFKSSTIFSWPAGIFPISEPTEGLEGNPIRPITSLMWDERCSPRVLRRGPSLGSWRRPSRPTGRRMRRTPRAQAAAPCQRASRWLSRIRILPLLYHLASVTLGLACPQIPTP